MPENLFGPYRLDALLGRGGMGEVFRAHHVEQGRTVALKLLLASLSTDPNYRERFLRESRMTAKLIEPHVIPVHNWGEIEGRLYIDMRFVEGKNLGSCLAEQGRLGPLRTTGIVSQVASALDAAHRADLVHRDVKPSNIMITVETEGDALGEDFAYLVDFGIARSIGHDGSQPLTVVGEAVGTYEYMAPERILGEEVDGRSDVYSLACVLYECLTGQRPFQTGEPAAMYAAHLLAEPPRPSQHPGVPHGFDDVVARGMAKQPNQRYPTAGLLAAAAREALTAPAITVSGTVLRGLAPPTADAPMPGSAVPHHPAVRPTRPPAPVPHRPAVSRPPPVRPAAVGPARPPAASGSQPSVRSGPSTPALWVAAALAAVITIVVTVMVLFDGNPTDEPGAPTPPPATSQRPLSDAENGLLDDLPPGFSGANCAPAPEQRTAEVIAALQCRPGPADGPTSALFLRYQNAAGLDQALIADARRRALPVNTGDCRGGDQLQSTWIKNGQVVGLLSCYSEPNNERTIRWTERRVTAMGVITRADGDIAKLYDWWTRYDFR
jgi:serine/threonine protein kinase